MSDTPALATLSETLRAAGFNFTPTFHGVFLRDGSKWFRGVQVPVGNRLILMAKYGDWRLDTVHTWRSEEPTTPEDIKMMVAAAQAFGREEAKEKRLRQEITAAEARGLWETGLVRGSTQYIHDKKLASLHGARIDPKYTAALWVPARDVQGTLWGFQKITSDANTAKSSKYFLAGMRIDGCFHLIGEITEGTGEVYVAEGFATAASIAEAMPGPATAAVAAFSAGNLAAVCTALRSAYPCLTIWVCGDDDRFTEKAGKPWNPGREKALEAAALCGGTALFPSFAAVAEGDRGTDFNDVAVARGNAEVALQLARAKEEALRALERPASSQGGGETAGAAQSGLLPVRTLPPIMSKSGALLPPKQQAIVKHLLDEWAGVLMKQGKDLFVYNGTHWRILSDGERDLVKVRIQKVCGGLADVNHINGTYQLLTMHLAGPPEGVDLFIPSPFMANFLNGTLHLGLAVGGGEYSLEFRPHARDNFLTHVLPYNYDAASTEVNTEFLDMLERVFQGDEDKEGKIRAVRQMYGACLMPAFPQLFMLWGPSGTGKSTVLNIASRLLDRENVCSVPPSEWHGFSMEGMAMKLVNIDTDIPLNMPIDDALVKKVADRKPFRIRRKGLKDIDAPIPAVHLFGGNGIPKTLDGASRAHTRRWVFLEFSAFVPMGNYDRFYWDYCFEQSPGGIVNFAMEGLRDLMNSKGHFHSPQSGKEEMEAWQMDGDPVGQFLDDISRGEVLEGNTRLMMGKEAQIERKILWEVFRNWYQDALPGVRPMTRVTFYRQLRTKKVREKTLHGVEFFSGVGSEEAGRH